MTALDAADLDALLDRLLDRAAERAAQLELVNVAGDTVVDGRAAGRVAVNPGDPIVSQWGNLAFDQSTVCFASTAERDAQWGAPHPGATCFTEADATFWQRKPAGWVTAGAGNRYAFRGYPSAYTTSATAGTPTVVKCTNAPLNQGGRYDPATGLYVCAEAGLHLAVAHGQWTLPGPGGYVICFLYRNGAEAARSTVANNASTGGYVSPLVVDLQSCAAGDTLAWWAQSNLASQAMRANTTESYFTVVYLGP